MESTQVVGSSTKDIEEESSFDEEE